jgi:hypothetical protein
MTAAIRENVRGYYESHWGRPVRRAEFETLGHRIEVYKWDEESTEEDVTLYATNGASERCAPPDSRHRIEFILGLSPEFDDIASKMSLLASFPLEGGSVSKGDTVTLDEPLWSGTDVRTFLVVPPIEDILPPLALDDHSHVEFLQVLPISERERQLNAAKGARWLLGELNDLGIATWAHARRYL